MPPGQFTGTLRLPRNFSSNGFTSSAANRAFGAMGLLINNYKKFEKSLLKGCHGVKPAQLFSSIPRGLLLWRQEAGAGGRWVGGEQRHPSPRDRSRVPRGPLNTHLQPV